MKTIFLRFPSESAYSTALAPFTNEQGNITIPYWDVIGPIYRGGEYDAEGEVVVEPELIQGWHVNALEVPAELEQYVIPRPNVPYRVFVGDAG